jgi:4'-phosphopantetheinyl transferase
MNESPNTNTIPAELSAKEVHIWLCEPAKITEPLLLNRYKSWLTEEENTKRLRYRFEKHQHLYLITRALIRSTLSHYNPSIKPQDWRFEKNHWGKPSLVAEQNPNNWVFNLSHTDGLIVCAITKDHALGVDVEDITRDGETIKIADRYFSPKEYQALIALPEQKQNDRFFDLWTLKESYIKACGKGLAIPLDEFSFSFPEDNKNLNDITLHTEPAREDDPSLWRFWNWQYSEHYRISMGIKNAVFSKQQLKDVEVKVLGCVPLMWMKEKSDLKERHI